jgi:hypothetical protein
MTPAGESEMKSLFILWLWVGYLTPSLSFGEWVRQIRDRTLVLPSP